MCGRTACSLGPDCIRRATEYVNQKNGKKVRPEWKDVSGDGSFKFKPRYNQAPTQMLPILTSKKHFDKQASVHDRVIVPMSWGLVASWHKGDRKSFKMNTINCRSDTLFSSKLFKPILERGQRGVLLCEGYFE